MDPKTALEQLLDWLWRLFFLGTYTLICALCWGALYGRFHLRLPFLLAAQEGRLIEAGFLAGLALLVVGGTAGVAQLLLRWKGRIW